MWNWTSAAGRPGARAHEGDHLGDARGQRPGARAAPTRPCAWACRRRRACLRRETSQSRVTNGWSCRLRPTPGRSWRTSTPDRAQLVGGRRCRRAAGAAASRSRRRARMTSRSARSDLLAAAARRGTRTPTARPPSSSTPSDVRAGAHLEVRPLQRGPQERVGRAPAPAVLLVDLEHRHAVLLGPVVVVRCAGCRRPRWRRAARWSTGARRALLATTRSAPPAPWNSDAPRQLSSDRSEVRQHVVPAPAAAPCSSHSVVVERPAADVEHRVHRARAAEALAARDVQLAAVDVRLGLGGVVPVELRVELVGERRRDLDVRAERSLPPASISSTRTDGSSVRRLASTQPADPAPTMT